MRFKGRKDRKSGESLLVVESDKGDTLDYVESELIVRGTPPFAVASYYDKGRTLVFTYDMGSGIPLERALENPIDRIRFCNMLKSFLELLESCENNSLSITRILFQEDCIYCNPDSGILAFAYLPTRQFVDVASNIRDAIDRMCRYAVFMKPEDVGLAEHVIDYVRRTPMLTSVDYRAFLIAEGVISSGIGESPVGFGENSKQPAAMPGADGTISYGFDFVAEQARQAEIERQHAEMSQKEGGSDVTSPMVHLRSLSDGRIWPVLPGSQSIGRADTCSIRLDGISGISRRHATLTSTDDTYTIRDEHSTNGVFVNGNRIMSDTEVILRVGDKISFGIAEFELS